MSHNKEVVRRVYEECINPGRLDALDALVSESYDGGVAAFRANIAELRAGFPDIRFTVEDLVADEDRVAVRWTWVATHDGTFRGIAPTHKRVTNSGIVIYRLRAGRIVASWIETDRLGALQQLGVVPSR